MKISGSFQKRSKWFWLIGFLILMLAASSLPILPKLMQRATILKANRGADYGISKGEEGAGRSGTVLPPSSIKDETGSGEVVLPGSKLPPLVQKVIKTAQLTVKVGKDRFDHAYDLAVMTAEGVGGYVTSSNSNAIKDDLVSGTITIRVPAQSFEKVLTKLRQLGKVQQIDVQGEDVSAEYVDLESRLKHWRAQEAILLDLMAKAKTISDTITVQNQLSQVQMEIEQITGRMRYLDNQSGFSTIALTIIEPQVAVRVDRWGFKQALEVALVAFMNTVNLLVVAAGYLSPFAVLGGAIWVIYAALKRKRVISST